MEDYGQCQSCGTPIKQLGTNADGSKNMNYCNYCYVDGKFTSALTLEEMIEHVVEMKKQLGAGASELADIRSKYHKALSSLKRWKQWGRQR